MLYLLPIFQCDWARLSKGQHLNENEKALSEDIQLILKTHYKARPKERLAPREALRGGRVECYDVRFDQTDEPHYRLIHIDYNSL